MTKEIIVTQLDNFLTASKDFKQGIDETFGPLSDLVEIEDYREAMFEAQRAFKAFGAISLSINTSTGGLAIKYLLKKEISGPKLP